MATVGSAVATLQQPLLSLPLPGSGLTPQANATPTPGAQQNADTVTLTGRSAETQQTGTQNGGAQFAESAIYFFAERQTFRAANGSSDINGGAKIQTAPQLPVKISEEGQTASQAQASAQQSAAQQAVAAGTTAATAQNQLASAASEASGAQSTGTGASATSGGHTAGGAHRAG